MDNFDIKKYLAEGKLFEENIFKFTDAGGNPITFEAFIGDFAAAHIPEGWDVDEDGTFETEIEAFTSEDYDEDRVANYNTAYDILSKGPFRHIYDTGEVLSITALNNGNLKFVYAKTIKEGKLLKEVRGPIEQIERHIKKGEEVDIVELRDDYGIEYNVDDEPLDDLFDIGYNDPDNPDGLALRDMSIVYDQRGDMYLMDTEDIKKYH